MRLFNIRRQRTSRKTSEERDSIDSQLKDGLDAVNRRHHAADPETARAWARLDRTLDEIGESVSARSRRGFLPVVRPAFLLAGAAAATLALLLLLPTSAPDLAYETGRGEQSNITLPDSSEVLLNHTTALYVEPLGASGMRVVKLQGEAFFRVRKGEAPFVVQTEMGTATVLGTEFNVSARNNRLEVAVLKGVVQVNGQEESRGRAVTLEAGQLTTCVDGGSPEPPAPLPFADYPGWVYRKLLFVRTSLDLACLEIEQRFNVRVHIENDSLRSATITGAIDAPSAGQAILTIARLTGAQLKNENGRYILY
jgi:ferric-dicitrate binding protein FerR (iron transport regulator)